jgi:hypothetical protein
VNGAEFAIGSRAQVATKRRFSANGYLRRRDRRSATPSASAATNSPKQTRKAICAEGGAPVAIAAALATPPSRNSNRKARMYRTMGLRGQDRRAHGGSARAHPQSAPGRISCSPRWRCGRSLSDPRRAGGPNDRRAPLVGFLPPSTQSALTDSGTSATVSRLRPDKAGIRAASRNVSRDSPDAPPPLERKARCPVRVARCAHAYSCPLTVLQRRTLIGAVHRANRWPTAFPYQGGKLD